MLLYALLGLFCKATFNMPFNTVHHNVWIYKLTITSVNKCDFCILQHNRFHIISLLSTLFWHSNGKIFWDWFYFMGYTNWVMTSDVCCSFANDDLQHHTNILYYKFCTCFHHQSVVGFSWGQCLADHRYNYTKHERSGSHRLIISVPRSSRIWTCWMVFGQQDLYSIILSLICLVNCDRACFED